MLKYTQRHLAIPVVMLLLLCFQFFVSRKPLVEYRELTKQDNEGQIKFQLATSVIFFHHPMSSSGVTLFNQMAIASVPVPDDSTTYSIIGTDWTENWGTETALFASYRGDTPLLESVGVGLTDPINQLSAPMSSVGNLMFSAPGNSNRPVLPKSISFSDILRQPKQYNCEETNNNDNKRTHFSDSAFHCRYSDGDYIVSLYVSEVPLDAISVSRLSNRLRSHNFYYAACRRVVVTAHNGQSDLRVPVAVVVADPRWIQSLRLPKNGKIVVSGSCGANIVAVDSARPSAVTDINNLIGPAWAARDTGAGAVAEPSEAR